MRHSWHYQPKMPPRPRLLHRQRLEQPGEFISIWLKQRPSHFSNPSRHICCSLPYFNIIAKKLPNKRPNRSLIFTDLLRNDPRQRQTPPRHPQLSS